MRVIIAAAGTGGHINPGIAIANKIKERANGLRAVGSYDICDLLRQILAK